MLATRVAASDVALGDGLAGLLQHQGQGYRSQTWCELGRGRPRIPRGDPSGRLLVEEVTIDLWDLHDARRDAEVVVDHEVGQSLAVD